MGLGGVLRLLASLQILPRLVSPAALLPAPIVIADPQHPVYFLGESLTLRCFVPLGEAVSIYLFYDQHEELVFTASSEPARWPRLVMTTEMGEAAAYSCVYWAVRDGQLTYSPRSQPVRVPVMDHPAAPSISATASGPWDDLVTILCSLPGSNASKIFQVFKNGHIIKLGVTSTPQGSRLQLHTSDPAIAGSYTCRYEKDVAGRKAQSRPSSPISIHLPAPPGAPSLSLIPLLTVYLPEETVTLTCSVPPGAHMVTGFQFSRAGGWRVSSRSSNTHVLIVTGLEDSGSYTCAYWIHPSLWGVRSQESQPVSISVTDHPSQPALSVDSPSGVVSEGLPLLVTCTSSRDDGERKFHFYKDGAEIVPGDTESEISTTDPGTSSRNVSVLSIPQAGPNSSGEITCGYEEIVRGRWVPSHRSRAVNVTVNVINTVPYSIHVICLLGIGGILILAGALTALICCCCRRKKRVEKLQESTKGSEGRECTKDLDNDHDNTGPNSMSVGAEQREQGSEVTYALIAFSALEAHTTQSKRKAQPAEDEHVLYSEVVTKQTHKADK